MNWTENFRILSELEHGPDWAQHGDRRLLLIADFRTWWRTRNGRARHRKAVK